MRKIVFIFIALIAIGQNVCAQGMTATLQSGDNLSVFYGVDAFIEAYSEAKDGDQITLSAGTFSAPIESITKSVKITGVGAYNESAKTVIASLTASGKDIRIEGIKFTDKLYVSGSNNLIVTRCWAEKMDASSDFTNALFDASVLKEITGMKYAIDFTFKNCTIYCFLSNSNTEYHVGRILNCVIYIWYFRYTPKVYHPHAIYKNCILGTDSGNLGGRTMECSAPSEFYNNVGFSISNESTRFYFNDGCINSNNLIMTYEELFGKTRSYPAQPKNAPNGDDGTVVGPYGGTGFSEYPAIPRIISKDIDGKTNDEGQINVKIEVKAEN